MPQFSGQTGGYGYITEQMEAYDTFSKALKAWGQERARGLKGARIQYQEQV